MAVHNISSMAIGSDTFNLKDPTKYAMPAGGIPQSDLEQTVKNKLDKTVVVSDAQPTESENKLWVDTDAGSGNSYQVPTVAEMQAADNSILGNLAMIESSPATQAHAVGDYIVWNGQLYKVTAAIAQGESLTTGTNVESTTVGEELKDEYEFGTIAHESFGRLYYQYSQKKKIVWLTWYGNDKSTSTVFLTYYLPSHIIPIASISFLPLTVGGWIEIYGDRKLVLRIENSTYAWGTGCFPTK